MRGGERMLLTLEERLERSARSQAASPETAASPLGETLAGILRRYMAAWQEFDHLDHILRCIGALSCCLEQEEAGRTLPGEETDRVRRFRETLCEYGSDLEGREPVEQGCPGVPAAAIIGRKGRMRVHDERKNLRMPHILSRICNLFKRACAAEGAAGQGNAGAEHDVE